MTKKFKQMKILICSAILMVLCISFIMVGIAGNKFVFAEEVPTVDVTELATASDSIDIGYKLKLVDEGNNFIGYVNSYECINPNHCTCISSTARILHENDLFNIQLFKSNFIEHYTGETGYHVKGLLNKDGAQFGWSGNFVPNLGDTEEIIIIVKLEPNKYNIIFDSQGGLAVANQSITYGDIIELPTTTKTGYDFIGWEINGQIYSNGNAFSVSEGLNDGDNITAIACWEEKSIRVSFNTSGGNTLADQEIRFGNSYKLPIPQKTAFDFVKWTRSDNGAEVALEGDSWSIPTDVTLIANWQNKLYNINYFTNRNGSITNNPTQMRIGDKVTLYNVNFDITERRYHFFEWHGFYTSYTFVGWYYDSALTRRYDGTFSPTDGLEGDTINLYAKHQITNYETGTYVGDRITHIPSYVTGIEIRGSRKYQVVADSRANPLTICVNNVTFSVDDNDAINAIIENNYLTLSVSGNNIITGGGNGHAAVTTSQLEIVFSNSSASLTLQGYNGANGSAGKDGADGKKGNNTSVTKGDAANGTDGGNGRDGKNGGNGGTALNASILKISSKTTAESLKFIGGNGGAGGKGGDGGAGGDGGDDDTASVNGKAGNGGKAGDAGKGGDGGNAYRAFYNRALRIINNSGASYTVIDGKVGQAGENGKVGRRGEGGKAGIIGKDGERGAPGVTPTEQPSDGRLLP